MSINGQQRQVPELQQLPRPLYARAESLSSGAWTPLHQHPWIQISYAIQGVLNVQTDAGSYIAPPQRAIWIPAHTAHAVFNSTRVEMRSLYLDPAVVPADRQHSRVLAVTPLIRELIRSFTALPVEYQQDDAEGRLVQVLLDQLLLAEEVELSLPMPTDSRLRALCEALQAQPDDRRSLSQWGAQLGASEKTLARLFQRETGMTFRIWRQRLRLLSALTPLESGCSVTEVALSCGYESTSAFIAAFRQTFACTPGEFFRN
ncbi:AraC family transcriptional regulator [Pokkaliibacter plantistimulans]|uniref:AraC family transcriptional regulator n=1 Tax=Pokkaliibacter plantistimulans TaxID=1635171 RepID=A0ABX5M1Z7_9GAMM|nr:helix-turn-helix transcriptional regulator [Pokkaliibacter plantistimulans]PXF31698.1 AraC family transcriptional regulator [Pokkaliibacter plantistimulans]